MKICIISVNKNDYAPKRIYKEGLKRNHEMHLTTWTDLYIDIKKDNIYIGDKEKNLDYFDVIVPRSPNFIAKRGKKIINKKLTTLLKLIIEYAKDKKIFLLNNNFFSSYQSLDKLAQQYFLFKNNLPGISSLHFSQLSALKSKHKINFPVVAKLAQGSLGTGVFKLKNEKELKSFIKKNDETGKFYLIQKYYPIDCDYRVLVLNKKALGVMKRIPKKGEWRTNVSQGGFACKVDEKESIEIKKLAESVAKKMFFDYVGVDILKHNKHLYVIEVNSLAQFRGFEEAFPKINVAEELIKLVEKKL
jgi:ribosomal protein S6--L-glutamate ligase